MCHWCIDIKSGSRILFKNNSFCLPSFSIVSFSVQFQCVLQAGDGGAGYVFHYACFVIAIVCHNIVSFRNCEYELRVREREREREGIRESEPKCGRKSNFAQLECTV